MSRVAIFVRKRNGQTEPFAIGKIAMAVYKALQAHAPDCSATQARLLGSKIAINIEKTLLAAAPDSSGKIITELEHIQDLVVQKLYSEQLEKVAQEYEAYRLLRAQQRESKYSDFGDPFFIGHKKYSQSALINHLLANDLHGCYQHIVKSMTIPSKNKSWDSLYESLFLHCYQNSKGSVLELSYLGWLHSQWSLAKHLSCISFLHPPHHIQQELSHRLQQMLPRLQEGASYEILFPIAPEDKIPPLKAQLLFSQYFPNDPMLLVLAKNAMELSEQNYQALFEQFLEGKITLPLQLHESLLLNRHQICFEKAITMGDNTESIFEGLLNIAKAVKAGCSVSVSLSSIRAQGLPVGDYGNKSAGIIPIANLIGQTCSMLSGVKGEPHKARLFLDVWHADLESFLSFFIQSEHQSNIKTALFLSDLFMKRVLEGKDWILGTPEELPRLKNAKSLKERAQALEYYCEHYVTLQKTSISLKKVPARDVFAWICKAIATGRGPAIIFKDLARGFDAITQTCLPSPRLGTLLIPDQDDCVIELGISYRQPEEMPPLLQSTKNVLEALIQRFSNNALGICYLPPGTPEKYTQFSCALLEDIGLPKNSEVSFWNTSAPFVHYRKSIHKSREGYLESLDTPTWSSTRKPLSARFLTQNPREEYLAFHYGTPAWSPQEGVLCQFQKIDRIFGILKMGHSTQEQAKAVAAWQSLSDQLLTWDVFLKSNSDLEVSEAIKTAWLYGINIIRKFNHP